jgi:pimeloyl-ACP methyl ester carboxylesterase
MNDVLVLLPGITGSVLERDGKAVWAPKPGAAWRALWSLGRSIKDLLIGRDDPDKDDLGDGVEATGLVQDLHVIPGLWGIDGYTGVRKLLQDRFDVVPGRNYIEFAYDWRRDNRVAARKLARTAELALHEARKTNQDAKLVLVGHSMGGLVSRYYLECLEGWKDTRMLITFGTPYRGSLNALDSLVNGFVKKLGPLKVADLSDLLSSFTSIYQLLPIYKCVDEGGGQYVRPAESTKLPRLDTKRAASALQDFHRAIETGAGQRPEDAYDIHPVVGLTQPTLQSARLAGGRLELLRSRRRDDGSDADESGDGTVPRVSATPIEIEQPTAVYASQRHAALQNADNVLTQLHGVLTQVPDLAGIRDVRSGLELHLDDVYLPGEPVPVEVRSDQPRLKLAATLTDLASGTQRTYELADVGDGRYEATLPALEPSDYRLEVAGARGSEDMVQPVADVFMCPGGEPDEEP